MTYGKSSLPWSSREGHATEEMVTEGLVQRCDKDGNDRADQAAELGATTSQAKVQAFGRLYSCRQADYRKLVCRIQRFIVALKEEEKRLRDEASRHKALTTPEEKRTVNIPKHLRYYGNPNLDHAGCAPPVVPGEGTRCTDIELQMHPINPIWYNNAEEGVELKRVQSFISELTWQPDEPDCGGITWLELFILYNIRYYDEEIAETVSYTHLTLPTKRIV